MCRHIYRLLKGFDTPVPNILIQHPPKRTSQNDDFLRTEAGIGGSSRSCLHEKHSVLLFFLGKRSLLVLRFASCEAVIGEAGIGGSSRSCLHEKHSVLLFFLGKRSLLVLRFASCEAVIGEAGIGGSSRSIGRILATATSPSAVGTADEVLLPSRRCATDQRGYDCSERRVIHSGSTTNRSGFSAHSPA